MRGGGKGLTQCRQDRHSQSHFSGPAETAPRTSYLSLKPQLGAFSSATLSETLQLKELSGLHHMELLPTLCFPRRLSIPPHKRILAGHLLTPGTGNTELHKIQLLPFTNSLSKGATDLKTEHSNHIKGCEGCARPKDRDPPILLGGFGKPSQRR